MNREDAMKIIESNRPIYRDWQEESMKIIKSNGPIYRDGQEEFDEAIERLQQPLTLAEFLGWEEGVEYKCLSGKYKVVDGELLHYWSITKDYKPASVYLTASNILTMREAEKVEHKNKYRIPLPNLITTDGMQQYLTERDGNWFASRLNPNLKQEWTVDEFKNIPEYYWHHAREMVK